MASLKITGAKAIINKAIFEAKCEEHAESMKENAIERAPKDTGKLKEEGIDMELIEDGAKVFLNLGKVDYGLYQELGWKQNTVHPGKFFMEKSFEIECVKAKLDAKELMKEALTVQGSNGYDIVEYRD